MSKLSFRAKALDAAKPMPVYQADDLPDLSECASINRAVPQMPTGMEKEEEMELHLQQVLSAQQALTSSVSTSNADFDPENVVIPIPRVSTADVQHYESLYKASDFQLPKQFIKIQAAIGAEEDPPDYDLDSDDERWLNTQTSRGLEIAERQFERMMDRLEKSSEHQVVKPEEAKGLLNEDDDIILAVYDYWLNKKLKCLPLISQVKTEKRDAISSSASPYVAFRRRAEKMQTRKNRKNDEESYEKMLRIRSDLRKAGTLLEMIKRREKSKRELLNLTTDIFERRFTLEDWNDELFNQLKADVRPAFQFSKEELRSLKRQRDNSETLTAASLNSNSSGGSSVVSTGQNRKRTKLVTEPKGLKSSINRHADIISRDWLLQNEEDWHKPTSFPGSSLRLQEEAETLASESKGSAESECADGKYAFKRSRGCQFYAALPPDHFLCKTGETPAADGYVAQLKRDERDPVVRKNPFFRYTNAYLHSRTAATGLIYVGLVRRRVGRGGRVVFDRVSTPKELRTLARKRDSSEPIPSTSAICSSRSGPCGSDLSVEEEMAEDFDTKILIPPDDANPRPPVFRPASPLRFKADWLDDDDDMGMIDSGVMWGSESVKSDSVRKDVVDGKNITICAAVVNPSKPASLSGIQIGVPHTLYGTHQDQVANWMYQQAELNKAVLRQDSLRRARLIAEGKLPPGNSNFHPQSAGCTEDLIDSSSAFLACSSVMTPKDLAKMITDLSQSQIGRNSGGGSGGANHSSVILTVPSSAVASSTQQKTTVVNVSYSGAMKMDTTPVAVFSGNGLMGSAPTGTKTISLTAVSNPNGSGGTSTVFLLKSPQSKLPNGSNGQSPLTRSPLAFQVIKRVSSSPQQPQSRFRPTNKVRPLVDYSSSDTGSSGEVWASRFPTDSFKRETPLGPHHRDLASPIIVPPWLKPMTVQPNNDQMSDGSGNGSESVAISSSATSATTTAIGICNGTKPSRLLADRRQVPIDFGARLSQNSTTALTTHPTGVTNGGTKLLGGENGDFSTAPPNNNGSPMEIYPPLTPSPSPNSRLCESTGSFILKHPANNNLTPNIIGVGSPKQGSELHLVNKSGVT